MDDGDGPIADRAATDDGEVQWLVDRERAILVAALKLNAVEARARRVQKEIVRAHDTQDDPNNYRHEFRRLRQDGYLLPHQRSVGCWLSDKGRRAAEQILRGCAAD